MLANGVTAEEVSNALLRLLTAPSLQVSDRNKRFLRYVVEETLANRGERIKSYSIAVDVFGRGVDFDGAVDSIVRTEATRLRAALAKYYAGEGAAEPIKILLPPGSYVPHFESRPPAAPATVDDDQKSPVPQSSPQPSAQPAPLPQMAPRRRIALGLVAAALAIVLAALLIQASRLWFSAANVSVAPTIILAMTQPIGDEPKIHSLAVGLTQSLVLSLTRYDGLTIARANEHQPADVIVARRQRKGGTIYILESSIDADSQRLRFRWRLVDAADQTVLWSDQIDEDLNGSSELSVEDRIADGVARIVGVRRGLVASSEQTKQTSHLTAGYACVLRALSYTGSLSATLHAEVRDCLERTVAQNPNYAEALALLAYVYVDEDRNGFNPRGSKEDILARASAASDRAVQLAPSSSLVQQMRSTVLFQIGDYVGFEQAARNAIALNPGNPNRLILLGNRLFALGRYEEGAALVRQAIAMQPFPSAVDHGTALLDNYRLANYRAAVDEAAPLNIDPNFYFLNVVVAAADGQLGDHAAAASNVAKVLKLQPDYAKTFRTDWRNRRFQEDFIEKVADGLRKAGLPVE